MRAHIISIGNEILLGEVVDTNSAWVADALTNMGIRVERALSVGDDRLAILEALSTSVGVTDFVFVTGGLGPTSDDITKDVLSECFDAPLVLDETVVADIEAFLKRRGIATVSERNNSQALVPKGCEVIPNGIGTAPGLWFERGATTVIAMPGVPHEMTEMMERRIIPKSGRSASFRRSFRGPF